VTLTHGLHTITAAAIYGLLAAPNLATSQAIGGPDSLIVVEVQDIIRRTNPELHARRAALTAAEARVPGAGSFAPAVLSAELEEVPGGFDVAQAGSFRVDLSRELFSGGRRGARRALAAQVAERARLELTLVERSLLASASSFLVRYLGGIAVAERLAAQDSLLAGAQDAVTTRFAVGDSRYVDVLRLRAERLRTRVEIAQARAEALRGRRTLTGLAEPADTVLGQLAARLDRLASRAPETLEMLSFPPVPNLDSLVQASAPVQLAEVGQREAAAGVRLAIAEQRTRVNASVGVQRFGGDDGGHRVGPTLGASVTLPFTAGAAGRAARRAAEQELVGTRAELRGAKALARAELGAALDQYEVAVANAALFEPALLRGAREERENALAIYRTGTLSLLELLDFERALTQAEISRLRSRVAAAEAFAELMAGAANVPEHSPFPAALPGGES